jgi:tRNA threonylcarbamoyladenosine biosynthesis protein TsaE
MPDLTVATAEEMERLGAVVAEVMCAPCAIFLSGPLAAGKTTFARGYLRALGHGGVVKSPTFTLVEPYRLSGREVNHVDLYRINDPEELDYLGLDEYFGDTAECLVEWPERAGGALPDPDLWVRIAVSGDSRHVTLEAMTEKGRHSVDLITKRLSNSNS